MGGRGLRRAVRGAESMTSAGPTAVTCGGSVREARLVRRWGVLVAVCARATSRTTSSGALPEGYGGCVARRITSGSCEEERKFNRTLQYSCIALAKGYIRATAASTGREGRLTSPCRPGCDPLPRGPRTPSGPREKTPMDPRGRAGTASPEREAPRAAAAGKAEPPPRTGLRRAAAGHDPPRRKPVSPVAGPRPVLDSGADARHGFPTLKISPSGETFPQLAPLGPAWRLPPTEGGTTLCGVSSLRATT